METVTEILMYSRNDVLFLSTVAFLLGLIVGGGVTSMVWTRDAR